MAMIWTRSTSFLILSSTIQPSLRWSERTLVRLEEKTRQFWPCRANPLISVELIRGAECNGPQKLDTVLRRFWQRQDERNDDADDPKKLSSDSESQIAVEAIRAQKTITELA